jgi:hypothetical protein
MITFLQQGEKNESNNPKQTIGRNRKKGVPVSFKDTFSKIRAQRRIGHKL